MRKPTAQAGQALVLVLLSLAVVLTLVLFILSRTITDIAVSTNEEEAIRAFSAAEAGVEQALIIGSISETNIGDAKFSADVSGFAEGSATFNYPINLASGDTATVWFVDHDADGDIIFPPSFTGNSIKICWGKPNTQSGSDYTPAVEFSVFYNDGTIKIVRAALDPNWSRTPPNSFTQASSSGCGIDGVSYQFSSTVTFASLGIADTNDLLYGKLRMLYSTDQNQTVGFDVSDTGDVLPSQGLEIDSLGQSGDSNRRLQVFQAWPEAPSIFDYTIFSSSGLTKQ
jgi:Tfp pilus assembly protein PilX